MTSQSAVFTLLVVALVLANLPWINERLFAVIRLRSGSKPFWVRLLEWGVGFGLVALLAWRLELGCQLSLGAFLGLSECPGELHPKSWEFYTVVVVLYAVFALPGFLNRAEQRRQRRPRQA
ncbi:MAG: DUF2818 family protein [Gammaproteobacteria bacterium]|nr:DUF2818 family protein [Gammaproteobacteria bacterium]